jgi:hypothetical protein
LKFNKDVIKDRIIKNEKIEKGEDYIKTTKDEKIFFPFFVVEYINTHNTQMEITLNEFKDKGIIRFNTQINILGDFEIVKKVFISDNKDD